MLIVRASVWMNAETFFTCPNLLHRDRVVRIDRHATGHRIMFVTSMSFSGDRAFNGKG